jgi:hypothetical protein
MWTRDYETSDAIWEVENESGAQPLIASYRQADYLPPLFFCEGPLCLVVEGSGQIGENGSGGGLDEGFDGHPGYQFNITKSCDLGVRYLDADRVEGESCLLILRNVGRDPTHLSIELGRGALVEGREAEHGWLSQIELINLLWRDSRLDCKRIGTWYNELDRLAWLDDTTDRVHRELMHLSVLRRPDVHAPELVLGRNPFFCKLRSFGPDF